MMTRRTFLQHTGAAASAALFYPDAQKSPRHRMGIQLYTMRAAMRTDLEGTIKRLAAMGYQEAETYGFEPDTLRYYGLDAVAFADRLKANGFTTPSGHYDLNRYVSTSVDDLKRYMDRCILGAKALGQTYITWPLLDPDSRTIDRFKVAAERLNIIGAQAKGAGLQVAYHNHDFEFVDQNGQIGYDILLKETDPALVKLQVDLYWMVRGSKVTPNEWFRRQPGRYVMWHVKDIHKESRDYTEVGNGTIDFTKIFPDAGVAGLKHFFVEQGGNFTHDPFRSVSDSAEYVKRMLLK